MIPPSPLLTSTAKPSPAADAFTLALMAARGPFLRRLRARTSPRTRARVDLEDVWQDVCVIALRVQRRFVWRGAGHLARWLEVVAMRRIARCLQQRSHREARLADVDVCACEAPSACCPARVAEQRELITRSLLALDYLPPLQRHSLTMRLFDGLDHQSAASRRGRSPEAARKACYRALLALRRILGV